MGKTIHEIVIDHLDFYVNHDVIFLKDIVYNRTLKALELIDHKYGDFGNEIIANIKTMTPDEAGKDFLIYNRVDEISIFHNVTNGTTTIGLNVNGEKILNEFLKTGEDEIARLLKHIESEKISFRLGHRHDGPCIEQCFSITGIELRVPELKEEDAKEKYPIKVYLTSSQDKK